VRVAALYDVHGNVHALEAVLAEVERERVDAIVFGGDIAAGPFPAETLALVRSLDAVCLRGNAERRDFAWGAAEWVWDRLGPEAEAWLQALPEQAVLGGVLFCHATPRSDTEIVTPATPDERLAEMLAGVEQELIVAGHTHMQQERRVGRWRFVNAGSVGRPYEDAPGAYWAIVGEAVSFRRTDYDLEAAAAATRASGHPHADELAAENVLTVPGRAEATAYFESLAGG
jgi:predicted phosphodiesterase